MVDWIWRQWMNIEWCHYYSIKHIITKIALTTKEFKWSDECLWHVIICTITNIDKWHTRKKRDQYIKVWIAKCTLWIVRSSFLENLNCKFGTLSLFPSPLPLSFWKPKNKFPSSWMIRVVRAASAQVPTSSSVAAPNPTYTQTCVGWRGRPWTPPLSTL